MVKGYRSPTEPARGQDRSLDQKVGARSESNIGAWLTPGVVVMPESWPNRGDVNAIQWLSDLGRQCPREKVVEANRRDGRMGEKTATSAPTDLQIAGGA